MKSSLFILNIFLSISLISALASAELIDLNGKTPQEYSAIIEEQKKSHLSKLGKHCAVTTQEEFDLRQNQITDADLKLSEAEFLDYLNKTPGEGYASEFAAAPAPSADTCFMTKQEYYALRAYTGSFYRTVNSALRDKVKTSLEQYRIVIKYIQSALTKFKPYEGFVKRGTSLPPEILSAHVPPNDITLLAFSSTSVAGGFGGAVNYIIQSRNCKYIAPFSKYLSEEEVLCAPGTIVRIVHREDVNGKTHLLADEMPSEFNIDEFLKTIN